MGKETIPLVIKTNPFVLLELKFKSLSREDETIFGVEIGNLKKWLDENISDSEAKKFGDNVISELKGKGQEEQRKLLDKFRGKLRRGEKI